MNKRLGLYTIFLLTLCAILPTPAAGGLVTMPLTCVMNGLDSRACTSAGPFGVIQLTDDGQAPGEIKLTVDLVGTDQKFKDLMLNVRDGFTTVSSGDGQASLDYNGFNINPYDGLFDLGNTAGPGWVGDDGYMTVLSANVPLNLDDFLFLDSESKLYAALHIQSLGVDLCTGSNDGTTNCIPGLSGTGSLKIGAPSYTYTGTDPVPEPGSIALVGVGLGILLVVRRRKSGAAV